MKIILLYLLIFSFAAQSQGIIVSGWRRSSPPETTFNWNTLTWEPVATYGAGGVLINNKKYSNLNTGNQFGSAIVVTGGQGKFEIKNSAFINTNGEAVQFENFGDGVGDTIWIHDCFFANGKNGISLVTCNAVVIIENNEFINPWGAKGGKGQAIQFNSVTCQPNSVIQDNEIEGYRGEVFSEDLFSSFNTSGTPGNPLRIRRNKTRGGGPSDSGGGFITGDGDGQYVTIEDNYLKNPGNYIVTIAGGGNNVAQNNYGWQGNFPWTNIAMYAYITAASSYCNNITITGNHMGLFSGDNYYCYCTPTCGDVIGVTEGLANASDGWRATNFSDMTEATIDALIPAQIINYLPENELWKVRDSSRIYRYETPDPGYPTTGFPASPHKPTANAGADQSIITTSTNFAGSATSTNGATYLWKQVSGPNTAAITNPASATSTVTGLTDGVYEFRLVVTDNDGAADPDWMTITVTSNTFYFNSTGDDSRTAAQAQNPATPWQTITKLNSYFSSLPNNATVAFNRGDTFYGAIIPSRSGLSAGVPITITAYGSGADPIVTGLTDVTAWTSLGGNIWESTSAVSTLSTMEMVVINNNNTPMGRSPNTGYYTYQSHVTNTTITSTDVNSGVTNWTGAEAVIKKNLYTTDRNPITAHSGSTLTYTSASSNNATDNFGFFIQNDVRTLDAANEWYYNTSTKKIRIYSTVSPTNVSVVTLDTLVYITAKNYIKFDNITFKGSNKNTFVIRGSLNITIQNCDIDYSGKNAIWGGHNIGSSSATFILQNSTINHTNNNAIVLSTEFTGALISNNSIRNTGIYEGMGSLGTEYKYTAAWVNAGSAIIEYNTIDSIGYNGVIFEGNSVLVRNNFITNFCTHLIDGAAIYSWYGTSGFSTYTGQKIYNNIILNGIGSNVGTTQTGNPIVHGIYLDDGMANVEVYGNTSANNSYSGLYLHNTNNCNIHDNTFYNNSEQQVLITSYLAAFPTRTTTFLRNICFSKTSTQVAIDFETLVNDITSFGSAASINSNYYARPIDDNLTIRTIINDYGTDTHRTLAGWKTYSGYDALGNKSPQVISTVADLRFEYNATSSPVVVSLPFNYLDVAGTVYTTSITIPAYGSAVLIKQSL